MVFCQSKLNYRVPGCDSKKAVFNLYVGEKPSIEQKEGPITMPTSVKPKLAKLAKLNSITNIAHAEIYCITCGYEGFRV